MSPRTIPLPIPSLALALLAALICCHSTESDAQGPDPVPVTPAPAPPAAPKPASSAPKLVPSVAEKYAATEVLIRFAGAAGAAPSVTRSDAEAKAIAEEVWRKATAGEPFGALAKRYSEGPAAPRGGGIGVFRPGTLLPELERAVAAIDEGAIAEPFRTAYGWHVVRRDAVVEITASHVLVSYAGAWRSSATRSKEEAKARIVEVLRKLAAGADFAAIAREYSEDAAASSGGDLGVIAPGQMIPDFETAAFALQPGQHSGIVETPYGYHIILRTK